MSGGHAPHAYPPPVRSLPGTFAPPESLLQRAILESSCANRLSGPSRALFQAARGLCPVLRRALHLPHRRERNTFFVLVHRPPSPASGKPFAVNAVTHYIPVRHRDTHRRDVLRSARERAASESSVWVYGVQVAAHSRDRHSRAPGCARHRQKGVTDEHAHSRTTRRTRC